MKRRFGILLLLLLLSGAAALSWCFGGFFEETNICTHCGAVQNVRRVFWIPFQDTRQTPLSLYQQSLEGAAPLPHRWMFASGHGGPIRCALGRGRSLFMAVRSTESVESLKAIRQHRGDAAAEIWKGRLLDPKTSTAALMALYPLGESPYNFDSSFSMATVEFQSSQAPPVD